MSETRYTSTSPSPNRRKEIKKERIKGRHLHKQRHLCSPTLKKKKKKDYKFKFQLFAIQQQQPPTNKTFD